MVFRSLVLVLFLFALFAGDASGQSTPREPWNPTRDPESRKPFSSSPIDVGSGSVSQISFDLPLSESGAFESVESDRPLETGDWINRERGTSPRLDSSRKGPGSRLSSGVLSFLGEPDPHKYTGFIDLNIYWDTRESSVFTINAGAKLPFDVEYFQFINLTSPLNDPSELEDWNDFFTEIHFRRPIAKDIKWISHLDWNLMWADGGFPSEVGRFGIRWRWQDTPGEFGRFVKDVLKLRFSTTFHLLEDDGSGWQMEYVYRREFLDGLLYIGGFADHNINNSASNSDWVSECQLGLKLYGNCFAVVEHRYNSFLPAQFRSGYGIGLEYFVPFR